MFRVACAGYNADPPVNFFVPRRRCCPSFIVQVCGLKSGDFVHTIGDAHVYLNHIDALREQLRRKPRPFPALHITPDKTDIDAFEFSDLELKGYLPHKSIKMKMAV